ncbi:putative amine oxidase [copper-containing] [Haliotis rufescens]|uniref:putative amine oxidase [copper-containing] n=1 Tax=Haliotis rufescens TaxID=6454 RepID=UPI00201EC783|nr:putative amine oxidase [copper-containing] [Haliotis rufescens]XP_046335330.2 putative amine oxidase [copper-containing] [Haliotis rufescens]
MTELQEKYRRSIGRWRCAAIALFLIALALVVALIAVSMMKDRRFERQAADDCGESFGKPDIDTSEAEDPGLYDDLTVKELKAIQDYLYSLKMQLNLKKPDKAAVNVSYIYVSDLHPPLKSEALAYLSGSGPKPERKARIVIFRGDAVPPVSEEYIVGPLPNPNSCKLLSVPGRKNPVPYAYRPVGYVEFGSYYLKMFPEIDKKIGFILKESYGATFSDCGDRCLNFYPAPVGTGVSQVKVRKMWFTTSHSIEYYDLNPVDFLMLANIDSQDPTKYFIEKLVYAGQEYASLDDLATQYRAGSIPKSKIPFPKNVKDLKSSLHRRGNPVPIKPQRAPRMYEPDGKRYSVHHRHVEYMQWAFDFRMSTLSGPQIYDIRFNNERIAYEVGLQEIAVFYASNNSATRSADYIDSGALIGTHSQSLVPGADCPETSTFFNYSYLGESSEEPVLLQRAFCLFELNQGLPLRRHLSYSQVEGGFYSGMEDNVLVLRSIMTVVNYDYVMDFIFHQSGAMEVRVLSTGYIFGSFYTPKEDPYGFQLKENTIGSIHHHLFLFKADVDIHGPNNRYETLDISRDVSPNSQTTNDPNSKYYQIKYERSLKQTEMDAAYKFNFEKPRYHVFHNNDNPTKFGAIKSYRIHLDGMTKVLIPEDKGNEPVISWSRNQMTVTKFKDDERDGSSVYGMFDSMEPTVNFTSFYADNDDIVDQDLVAWISMGVHHIPHTEDMPITPTPGAHLSFALLPYNYFEECPSSQSRDSIRVEYKDSHHPEKGARVVRYGNAEKPRCIPNTPDYDAMVERNPSCAIETSYVHHEAGDEYVSANGNNEHH